MRVEDISAHQREGNQHPVQKGEGKNLVCPTNRKLALKE
jgi:hypothetical protein